jgi:hypothetical protein
VVGSGSISPARTVRLCIQLFDPCSSSDVPCHAGVISLDLGWSEAIEGASILSCYVVLFADCPIWRIHAAQAFDRVHRLGQTRPVFVDRLVITDTVEDRVLALQERKRALADGSLGEGSGKKIGRLSVRELASCTCLRYASLGRR